MTDIIERAEKMHDNLIERLHDWTTVWPEDVEKPDGSLYLEAAAYIEELEAKLAVAVDAFDRQADSMAFILNNVFLPSQWWGKLNNELTEDRAALAEIKGEKP